MKQIAVKFRTVYGVERIYPANDAAMALADIAGTATLSPGILRNARDRLGLQVIVHQDDVTKLKNLMGDHLPAVSAA